MLLTMTDPASIAAWVRIWPDRHWPLLKTMVRLQPQWREAAREAQQMLREPSNAPLGTVGQNRARPVGRR